MTLIKGLTEQVNGKIYIKQECTKEHFEKYSCHGNYKGDIKDIKGYLLKPQEGDNRIWAFQSGSDLIDVRGFATSCDQISQKMTKELSAIIKVNVNNKVNIDFATIITDQQPLNCEDFLLGQSYKNHDSPYDLL